MSPVLDLSGVGLRFGSGPERLSDVTLTMTPGMIATITGPAGSGKTLLAQVAALIRRPSRGSVRLFGRETIGLHPAALAKLRFRIGYVDAQEAAIIGLTPVENVALPLRLAGVPAAEAEARANDMLSWLTDGSRLEAGLIPAHLVALARAAAAKPDLLLIDEAAAFLPAERQKLWQLIGQFRLDHVSVLIISRDARILSEHPSDLRLFIGDGRLGKQEVSR